MLLGARSKGKGAKQAQGQQAQSLKKNVTKHVM
jgi:hypothetical protein